MPDGAGSAQDDDSPRIRQAIAYAARGWRVVQLHGIQKDGVSCTCMKQGECRSAGKHPIDTEWQLQDPMTEDEIRKAWSGWRERHNLGIATGTASGFFVVDVDPEHGGDKSLARLEAENEPLTPTLTVRTGSGGEHRYYALPDDFDVTNSPGALKGTGIDIRGNGGQVVAPPSFTDKGGYEVIDHSPIAEPDGWLLEKIRPKQRTTPPATSSTPAVAPTGRHAAYAQKAWDGEVARLRAMRADAVREGEQYEGEPWDITTFEVSCNLLELANGDWTQYSSADAVEAVLLHAPRDSGFTDDDVQKKIKGALDKVSDKARPAPADLLDDDWSDWGTTSPSPSASASASQPAEPLADQPPIEKGATVKIVRGKDAGTVGRVLWVKDGRLSLEDEQGNDLFVSARRCEVVAAAPAKRKKAAPVAPLPPDAPVQKRAVEESGALDGVQVLDAVRAHFGRYIRTMHEGDLDVLTLWAAHTHLVQECYTTPRLQLDSPAPGSGKTTALEHLSRTCVAPVQMASLSSPALLTRMLQERMRTMLIDEADRSLDPENKGTPELLAVLNSGYKRGGTRPVLVPDGEGGWTAQEMPTFCPVAMAGNNPRLPEDTASRTIRVLLLPDLDGRVEESDWEVIEQPTRELGEMVAAWAEQVRDELVGNRPALPEGIIGRSRERWSPLKRVAVAAGGRWPDAVDALAVADHERLAMEREDGLLQQRPAVVLLRHLAEVWPDAEPFVATERLVSRLVTQHPSDWGLNSPYGKALTAQRFGRMLNTGYGLTSGRLEKSGPRGYALAALTPVWKRMGVPVPDAHVHLCKINNEGAPVSQIPLSGTGASGGSGATGAGWDPFSLPCEVCGQPSIRYAADGSRTCGGHEQVAS